MPSAFDGRVATLGDDLSSSAMAWLHDVFKEHGAISGARLSGLGGEHQLRLARIAFDLVGHDMAATAGLDPPSFEFADEEGSLRRAFRGHYSPSLLIGLTQSESSVEVADFVQEDVMEDPHQVWPECGKNTEPGCTRR